MLRTLLAVNPGLHFLFQQWVLGENGALKAKLVHMSTYQPPSLKGKWTLTRIILCVFFPCTHTLVFLVYITNDTKWKNLGDLILLWQPPCGLYLSGLRTYPKTTMRVCVCACVCHVRLGAVAAVSLFWIILDYRMAAQL